MDPRSAAIEIVRHYVLSHLDKTDEKPKFEVYIVWFCFILGNWKALVSTSLHDGMYYEVTHNTALDEYYLDAYKKFENQKMVGPLKPPHDDTVHDITSVDAEVRDFGNPSKFYVGREESNAE